MICIIEANDYWLYYMLQIAQRSELSFMKIFKLLYFLSKLTVVNARLLKFWNKAFDVFAWY